MVLLTLMAFIVLGVVYVRNLFAVVALTGAFSFLMASVMMVLDAVDVAMTEASVGAGISTVLLLGALYLTKATEAPPRFNQILPAILAIAVGGVIVYGSWGLPGFGLAETPVNTHVGEAYIERVMIEADIPNVVTAVLASYRGWDTLGETAVIFTAGIGVLLLLSRGKPETEKGEDEDAS